MNPLVYFETFVEQIYFILVVDPHFWKILGKCSSNSSNKFCEKLEKEGWIQWKCLDTDFCDNSFYNFCLPQIKSF